MHIFLARRFGRKWPAVMGVSMDAAAERVSRMVVKHAGGDVWSTGGPGACACPVQFMCIFGLLGEVGVVVAFWVTSVAVCTGHCRGDDRRNKALSLFCSDKTRTSAEGRSITNQDPPTETDGLNGLRNC